jgi:NACalpha-BTF3-like transcription factor
MKHLSKINESDYDDWKRDRKAVKEADMSWRDPDLKKIWKEADMSWRDPDLKKIWKEAGGDVGNIKSEDIDALMKHTGLEREECVKVLKSTNGNLYKAYDYLIKTRGDKIKPGLEPMEKPKKDKKIFKIGDVIIRTKMEQGKLTDDCMEFLRTYKYFKVQEINANLNIDIGYRTPEGEKYWFSPNNFELKDKPKEVAPPPKPAQPPTAKTGLISDDDWWGGSTR